MYPYICITEEKGLNSAVINIETLEVIYLKEKIIILKYQAILMNFVLLIMKYILSLKLNGILLI